MAGSTMPRRHRSGSDARHRRFAVVPLALLLAFVCAGQQKDLCSGAWAFLVRGFDGMSAVARTVSPVSRRDRAMNRDGSFVDAEVVSETRRSEPSKASDGDSQGAANSTDVGPDGLPVAGTPPYKARMALLRRIGSLERGSNATALDDAKIRKLAEKLRLAAEEQEKWSLSFPEELHKLEGRWKLLYTSGFVNRGPSSLGGLRSGPPLSSPVLEVGDIEQVYRVLDKRADTVVTLKPPQWLRDTGFLSKLPFASESPDTVITLSQQFDVAEADTLRFAFVDGQASNKLFEQLKPLRFPMSLFGMTDTSRDGPFTDTLKTTYCDGDIRIGIGGRFGELRVFRRSVSDPASAV